jgi:ketosteroid isomerase-like protein
MNVLSQADDSATSKCPECGAAISLKAKFCEECGALQTASPTSPSAQGQPPVKNSVKTCINCWTRNPADSSHCSSCGNPFSSPNSEAIAPSSGAAARQPGPALSSLPRAAFIALAVTIPLLGIGVILAVRHNTRSHSAQDVNSEQTFAAEQNDTEGYEGRQWGSEPVGDVNKSLENEQMELLGFAFNVPVQKEIVGDSNLGERLDTQSLPPFTSEASDTLTYIYQDNALCAVLVHADAHNYDNVRAAFEGNGYSHISESSVEYRRLGDESDGDSTRIEAILYKRGSTNTRVYLMKYINHSPVFDDWGAYILYMPTYYYNAISTAIQTGVQPAQEATSTLQTPLPEQSSPAQGATSASPEDSPPVQENKEQDIRDAVDSWANAFRARDIDRLADCYAPKVEQFFRKKNVSRSWIHDSFQASFGKMENIYTYDISNLRVEFFDGSTPRATAAYNKEWDTSQIDGKRFSGEEIERLTFEKTDEGWKIVREDELQVIRTSRQ